MDWPLALAARAAYVMAMTTVERDARPSLRAHWALDPSIRFLNHGSFGACPRAVLDAQAALREHMEREPVSFFMRELEPRTAEARVRVAAFVGARPEDLGFVRNATYGVGSVLRSLRFEPGDELLTTDHAYGACKNALEHEASRYGARVTVAKIPFPLAHEDEALAPILAAVTARTRLALIDHVTSPTGLVLPIARIVEALAARGVDTLVDGAHAPGMIALDLEALGAAYYTANFHKWTCAPKGAAMLWARRDKQANLHPLAISHGYASRRPRGRFLEELDWTGTDDPTSFLCVPAALDYVGGLLPGGWDAVRAANRALAMRGRAILCDTLSIEAPAPESMIGSLVALPVPPGDAAPLASALLLDPLQERLFEKHQIEVPVFPWPAAPQRLLRISAHLHNEVADYEALADALPRALAAAG